MAVQHSSSSGMNSQALERFNERQKQANAAISTARWLLFRQSLVHAIIPAIVLSLSLVRVLRN